MPFPKVEPFPKVVPLFKTTPFPKVVPFANIVPFGKVEPLPKITPFKKVVLLEIVGPLDTATRLSGTEITELLGAHPPKADTAQNTAMMFRVFIAFLFFLYGTTRGFQSRFCPSYPEFTVHFNDTGTMFR